MTPDTIREALGHLARRRAEADRQHERATAELASALLAGREAGLPVAEMARRSGISRNGVYDLIAWRSGESQSIGASRRPTPGAGR